MGPAWRCCDSVNAPKVGLFAKALYHPSTSAWIAGSSCSVNLLLMGFLSRKAPTEKSWSCSDLLPGYSPVVHQGSGDKADPRGPAPLRSYARRAHSIVLVGRCGWAREAGLRRCKLDAHLILTSLQPL